MNIIFAFIFLLLCGMILGYSINELFEIYQYEKLIDGLHIDFAENESDAVKIAQSYDEYGSWVCINVRNMDSAEIDETCRHEATHELISRYCSKNDEIFSKCASAIEKI